MCFFERMLGSFENIFFSSFDSFVDARRWLMFTVRRCACVFFSFTQYFVILFGCRKDNNITNKIVEVERITRVKSAQDEKTTVFVIIVQSNLCRVYKYFVHFVSR